MRRSTYRAMSESPTRSSDEPGGVSVRPEVPSDAAAVYELNRRAFGCDDEARLVEALRGTADIVSLVADLRGEVVGHILFTPVTIGGQPGPPRALGLGPMAVLPELQNRGIGSRLVRAGLDAARRAGYEVVVVVGHPAFYPRFGFMPASRKGLRCEYAVPDEAFMVTELEPAALRGRSGIVQYLPVFSGV